MTITKNLMCLYRGRKLMLPVLSLMVSLFFHSITNAQNDPKQNPGPVNIQKVTVINRVDSGSKNDSLADVKVDYNKPDSTTGTFSLTVRYSVAEKNTDPVKTNKEDKAVIYDQESQQLREASEKEVRQIVEQVIQNPPKNFIYFLDGKESTIESIRKLNPDNIKTIDFLKNEDAVKKYGEKARNGVIALTTK